jgi:hypothetical protein
MKRLAIIAGILAVTFAAATEANAATIPVKPCGVTRTNWLIGAGGETAIRYPTTCRFAWRTYRKVRAKQRRLGKLPWHFRTHVGRFRLRCKVVPVRRSWQIRCKDLQHFVVLAHSR